MIKRRTVLIARHICVQFAASFFRTKDSPKLFPSTPTVSFAEPNFDDILPRFFFLLMQQRCTLGAAVSGAQTAFVTLNLIDYSLEHSLDHLLPGQLKPSAKLMQWIHLFDLNLRS